jgi:purine-cytosine permease-like protein
MAEALGGRMSMERRSIEFVPEAERHGRVADQGPFWFLGNFQFYSIAIGFVGPSLGLSLGYTAIASIIGILIGTGAQAFHASQGPQMGLPQMIQSRAQFGYRGVIVPLAADMLSLVGYNIAAAVLIGEGAHGLWGINRTASTIGVSLAAGVLALWGHDWLHRVFRWLFWISLPLFSALSLAILAGRVGGAAHGAGGFGWPAFMTQVASAASFNLSAAPYVSDFTRYLPSRTRPGLVIAHVFGGSAVSAIWLIILGAWLATHMGVTDGLLAIRLAGNGLIAGLGSVLAAVSIAALVATMGMSAYSAMLVTFTVADCARPVRPSRGARIWVVAALTLGWTLAAILFGGDAVTYLNATLVVLLYFLAPWTAVNLVDYFFVRKGRYSIPDLFSPKGVYGAWGARGLVAYAAGFLASLPFFVVPNVYTGPIAARLGGVDFGWLVGLVVASAVYLFVSRDFDPAKEATAIADHRAIQEA